MKFPFGSCLHGSEVAEQAPDLKRFGYDESFSHRTKDLHVLCLSLPFLDRCAESSSDEQFLLSLNSQLSIGHVNL